MTQSPGTPISEETIRQFAAAAGVRPDESTFAELAKGLGAMLAAIERAEELGLAEHEPCTTLRLSGGPTDAEL